MRWTVNREGDQFSELWKKCLQGCCENGALKFFEILDTSSEWKCITDEDTTCFSGPLLTLIVLPNDSKHIISGYSLSLLNANTASRMALDKKATHTLLTKYGGAPIIEHEIFVGNQLKTFHVKEGAWNRAVSVFNKWGQDVVVKAIRGNSGTNIFRATNLQQLDTAFRTLTCTIVMTPYHPIIQEWRVLFLREQPSSPTVKVVCWQYKRPLVVKGDGRSTLLELLAKYPFREGVAVNKVVNESEEEWSLVLREGEEWRHWKCNQSYGADAVRIKEIDETHETIKIAKRAANILALNFGCIDVLQCQDGSFKVVEANTGVFTEFFDEFSSSELCEVMATAMSHLSQRAMVDWDKAIQQTLAASEVHSTAGEVVTSTNSSGTPEAVVATGDVWVTSTLKLQPTIEAVCADLQLQLGIHDQRYIWDMVTKQPDDGMHSRCLLVGTSDFGGNTQGMHALSGNKVSTSLILHKMGIPHVPHYPCKPHCMRTLFTAVQLAGSFPLVMKTAGTSGGGIGVHKIECNRDIEIMAQSYESVSLCKLLKLIHEYRVVVGPPNGDVCVLYSKQKFCVVGDGKRSLLQLVADRGISRGMLDNLPEGWKPNEVLQEGELKSAWKYNLSQGATPCFDIPNDKCRQLTLLAQRSMQALSMNFAAVDIVEDEEHELLVLEINSAPGFSNLRANKGTAAGRAFIRPLVGWCCENFMLPPIDTVVYTE